MKLKKSAMFTDIHFGRKNNSEQHNQDCLNFVSWFVDQVKKDKSIDHVIFLGDWFETRSAIDQSTIHFSHQACDQLNDLNIPIHMLVGNHDLYTKHSREIHSTNIFKEYDNFIIVDEPTVFDNIGTGSLLMPFIFKEEYQSLKKYKDCDTWFGHLELNNFYITGYHKVLMDHAVDVSMVKGPSHVFTGHFHKRQSYKNVIYIGSPFGYDFSDIDDFEKGMCVFDHTNKKYEFIDYVAGPKFTHYKISEILKLISKDKLVLLDEMSLKIIIDTPIEYETQCKVKELIDTKYKLRNLVFEEEVKMITKVLEETELDEDIIQDLDDVSPVLNELVLRMLETIDSDKIDNQRLIKIYKQIQQK